MLKKEKAISFSKKKLLKILSDNNHNANIHSNQFHKEISFEDFSKLFSFEKFSEDSFQYVDTILEKVDKDAFGYGSYYSFLMKKTEFVFIIGFVCFKEQVILDVGLDTKKNLESSSLRSVAIKKDYQNFRILYEKKTLEIIRFLENQLIKIFNCNVVYGDNIKTYFRINKKEEI